MQSNGTVFKYQFELTPSYTTFYHPKYLKIVKEHKF